MTFLNILHDLHARIRRATPLDGIGIRTEASAQGTRLHLEVDHLLAAPIGGTGSVVPAMITGGGPGPVHTGAIHANGADQPATAEQVTIRLLQLAADATVSPGTWLLVTRIGTTYWGQIPVWS